MATVLLAREGKKREWIGEVKGLLEARRSCPFLLIEAPLSGPSIATYLAGWIAISRRTVLYIDAANAFDPYLVSRLARQQRRDPQELLQRIFVSRPFTCYQLQTLLQERTEAAAEEMGARLVILSGMIDLLLDEAVQDWEARRIMGKILQSIGRVREKKGIPFLATQGARKGPSRRRSLLLQAEKEAQVVGRLKELSAETARQGGRTSSRGLLQDLGDGRPCLEARSREGDDHALFGHARSSLDLLPGSSSRGRGGLQIQAAPDHGPEGGDYFFI